jgi:DNA-binding IclR family transcriptional regulator
VPPAKTSDPGHHERGDSSAASTGPVPLGAVEKAIQILDLLGQLPEGLDLQAIAARVGMSASGAYRTLQTLVGGGLVIQEGRRGAYRLGPRILTLARSMSSEAALVAAAEPEVHALAEATGESVALAVVRGDRIWSIVAATGSGDLVAQPRLAHGEPNFHTTGRGKLHLAYLPRAEARALIQRTGLPKAGPNSITDEDRLWREVEETRARGYAVNRAERSPHLAGVAIPVFGAGGELAATLGITVPVYTLTPEREAELARLGLAAARRIQAKLHGTPPQP